MPFRAPALHAPALRVLLVLLAMTAGLLATAPGARAALGWQPTLDLASPLDGAASQPALAVDRDGTVWGAWIRAQSSGGPSLVQVASKPRGGAWSASVVVSRPVRGDTGSRVTEPPRVAVRDGVVTVAWLQTTPDSTKAATSEAWVATRPAGGTWRAPEQRSAAGDTAGDLALVARPDGGATLAWTEEHALDVDTDVGWVVSADRSPEGTWAPAVEIAPTTAGLFTGYLDMAVDETGATTLVWQDVVTDGPTVLAVRRPRCDVAWSAAAALSDPSGYALWPDVAVGPDGSADVVWASRIDEVSSVANYDVQTARAAGTTTAWSAATVLSEPGGEALGRITTKVPTIAVDGAGNTTVAWLRSKGTNAQRTPDRVQVVTRPAGASAYGAPVDVWSGRRNATLRKAVLAVSGDGGAAIGVSGYTDPTSTDQGGPRSMRAVVRPALGAAWTSERELSVGRGGTASAVSWEPAVVQDAAGGTTIAWHQTDATGEIGVQAASFLVADPAGGFPRPAPSTLAPCRRDDPPAPGAGAASAAALPAAAVAGPATGSRAPAALRAAPTWLPRQSADYVAAHGVRVSFRGPASASATVVVRRGRTLLGRVAGVRTTRTGKLVRRVRLTAAGRRVLRRARGPVVVRVTVAVGGRTASRTVTLR
ncbi:hypothetical protein [Patulibacter sp. SYSU D01012]|uniref:hypothetical protein n=1 Tax=Patulibacter sp. SYSU D01012 TaxID=2817381 RepID=UPI001B306E0C|nr:hypothetical protein [Patulibacter sp. SYSU D01012]